MVIKWLKRLASGGSRHSRSSILVSYFEISGALLYDDANVDRGGRRLLGRRRMARELCDGFVAATFEMENGRRGASREGARRKRSERDN